MLMRGAPWSAMRKRQDLRRPGSARRAPSATASASAFSAQTTTDGPEPESVTPAWPVTGSSRSSCEQRRVGERGKARADGRGRRRRAGSASPRGDGGAEQRGLRGCGGGLAVREVLGQAAARLLRVHARARARRRSARAAGRRRCRARVRRRRRSPDQADAAAERRGEVVGVALERQAELEQLVGRERRGRRPSRRRRGRRRSSPRTSRARARAGSG